MMSGMDWDRLSQAIIDRRAALGHRTRESLAAAANLSSRLLGDLEHNRRQNYDRVTLSRVEQSLEWPSGTINRILRGQPYPGMPDREPVDLEVELMTAPGVLANLYAPKIELTELIHGSGLGPVDRYEIIREHRLAQQEFDRQQHVKIEADIRRRVEAQESDGQSAASGG